MRDTLTTRIIDSILLPELGWTNVADLLAQSVDAAGTALLPVKVGDRPLMNVYSSALGNLKARYEAESWYTRDTRERGIGLWKTRSVFIDQDYLSQDEFDRDPLIQDLLRPEGLGYLACMSIRMGDAIYGAAIQRERHKGYFSESNRGLLESIAPDLNLAARISHQISSDRLKGQISALDQLNLAVFVVNQIKGVKAANARAEGLLTGSLRLAGGRLGHHLKQHDDDIQRLIAGIVRRAGFSGQGAPVVLVADENGKPELMLRGMGLAGTNFSLFSGIVGLVVAWPISGDRSTFDRLLPPQLRFSPAETRLAKLMVQRLSTQECADLLALSIETVRSQQKSMFAKTGVNRQAALSQILTRITQFDQK